MNRFICCFLILAICLAIVPCAVFADDEVSQAADEPFVNKMFQGVFVGVMTIGLIGLPAYFWLNARRNRLLREYKEKQEGESESEEDSSDE